MIKIYLLSIYIISITLFIVVDVTRPEPKPTGKVLKATELNTFMDSIHKLSTFY